MPDLVSPRRSNPEGFQKPPRATPGVLLHNSFDWQGSSPKGFQGNPPDSLAGGEGLRVLS